MPTLHDTLAACALLHARRTLCEGRFAHAATDDIIRLWAVDIVADIVDDTGAFDDLAFATIVDAASEAVDIALTLRTWHFDPNGETLDEYRRRTVG